MPWKTMDLKYVIYGSIIKVGGFKYLYVNEKSFILLNGNVRYSIVNPIKNRNVQVFELEEGNTPFLHLLDRLTNE